MTISQGVKKAEKLLLGDKALARRFEITEMSLRERGKKKYFIPIA
jgi:hypothetical protein